MSLPAPVFTLNEWFGPIWKWVRRGVRVVSVVLSAGRRWFNSGGGRRVKVTVFCVFGIQKDKECVLG
jgi:hypothetical protein